MPRFKVTVRGTLKFDRTIELYASSDDDACKLAEEMMNDKTEPGDELDIPEIDVDPIEDKKYEIGIKIKDKS